MKTTSSKDKFMSKTYVAGLDSAVLSAHNLVFQTLARVAVARPSFIRLPDSVVHFVVARTHGQRNADSRGSAGTVQHVTFLASTSCKSITVQQMFSHWRVLS